ncbi:MAG: NUDIX domain-containing protein [Candidatus Ornithospirochaeta sp.]
MTERITTAGVAIENGKVLVARRTEGGPLSLKWEFVGGKNRYGESVGETLCREWMEELSLSVEVGEYLTETEFSNGGVHYILKCHKVKILGGEIKLCVHSEVLWAGRKELEALDFGPSDSVLRDWVLCNDLI